jgi:hypothetical protein
MMPRKDKRRSQIDDLKTAYHVVNIVQQTSWLRHEWDDLKDSFFAFFICGIAAAFVLLLGGG